MSAVVEKDDKFLPSTQPCVSESMRKQSSNQAMQYQLLKTSLSIAILRVMLQDARGFTRALVRVIQSRGNTWRASSLLSALQLLESFDESLRI